MTRNHDFEISGANAEDYDFIANPKQDIPELLKEIQKLKLIIKNMREK